MDVFEWVASVVGAVLAAWLTGLLNRIVPGAARCKLALANLVRIARPASDDRFRFVLCRLEGDGDGRDTETVAKAFREVSGVELVRSDKIVKAEGAADRWRPAMRKRANAILQDQRGDLAIVGSVAERGKALNLWFVPREGDGTLARESQLYELKHAMLKEDFHNTLREQLVATALSAVAPLVSNEARGRVLAKSLEQVARKLDVLLQSAKVNNSLHRADLLVAYGAAISSLGERGGQSEHLERSVAAYQEALKAYTRERTPLVWAATQNGIGAVLSRLGEWEGGRERLKQAVSAYREALKERTRQRVPLDWAAT